MLDSLQQVDFGDEAFGDDHHVAALEDTCAQMFGKQAALFTNSGTMSNQLAIAAQTRPGDEVITERRYHVNYYESAATAGLSSVAINAIDAPDAVLTKSSLEEAITSKARGLLYARPRLVSLENTIGALGGTVVPYSELREVSDAVRRAGLSLHLDGARLANASVATGVSFADYADLTDTVSLCFAKGLGAPFGSILVGSGRVVARARTLRKRFGGALHQSGLMAVLALRSLQNIDRLRVDHDAACALGALLDEQPLLVVDPAQIQTNMVLVDVSRTGRSAAQVAEALKARGVLTTEWGPTVLRFVCHLDVSQHVEAAAGVIHELLRSYAEQRVAA